MLILGIDPGSTTHGYVLVDTDAWRVVESSHSATFDDVVCIITSNEAIDAVAIERPHFMGKRNAFKEVFETIWWAAGFYFTALKCVPRVAAIPRKDVKTHLLGASNLAKSDSLIMRKMQEQFSPDALIGVAKHAWQALGTAVTYFDLYVKRAAK